MTGTDITVTGLTTEQAAARRRTSGPNEVPAARPRRLPGRIGHQLRDPLILLLLAAGVVTTLLGDLTDTAVIALVIVANTSIGVAQEVRADQAIAALNRLAAPTARVVRDGQDVILPAAELVQGDLLRLEAGDIVPADPGVRHAYRLQRDGPGVTGGCETVPRD